MATRLTRPISWVAAAKKRFDDFPLEAQDRIADALTAAAEGSKDDSAKPMKGMGSGVFEIALKYEGDAYRTIYVVPLGEEVWVIHAFQKKSTKGIKTPRHEIKLIKNRLTRLKRTMQ